MRIGLVLEGGAMRGMFTAGVLDTFIENGIHVDEIVGVSAGALFGVNFVSGQKGRAIRYNKRYNPDPNYLGLRPLLWEGNIVSTHYAYEKVPHVLDPFDDEAYKAAGVPFHAVVTNVQTGEPEYIRINSVFEQMDVLRASGSMPIVSKPVTIHGKRYLDGGISDSIPYEWLAKQGCDKIIAILTRDAQYRKKPVSKAIELYRLQFPAIAAQMKNRHLRYNKCIDQLKQWQKEGRVFIIRPSEPITIGTIEKNPERLQAVYDLGVRNASESMNSLMAYLMCGA